VDEEVDLAPGFADAVEHGLELAGNAHVHRQEDRCLHLARERLDMRFRLVVEVGEGQFGAERAEGAGAPPGDRLVVRDPHDEALPALENLRLDVR
jgi:hypothetical protein